MVYSDTAISDYSKVQKAFSKQSRHFDQQDQSNPILVEMRSQVRQHVNHFIEGKEHMLELNAGTGLDAVYFAGQGVKVHATDLSHKMIKKIQSKIEEFGLEDNLTCQQCSFTDLHKIKLTNFDYIFSNFGGLNCIQDLEQVTQFFPDYLNLGGFVTLVIMPPVCPWELISLFRGNFAHAFRRYKKQGLAHLEGEIFPVYYHSLHKILRSLPKGFDVKKIEGLGALIPPPYKKDFPERHPDWYRILKKLDGSFRNFFPFNQWADHFILTLQFNS